LIPTKSITPFLLKRFSSLAYVSSETLLFWLRYEDGSWQVFITVDGWSKLMNQHPAFCGIEFTESPESINNIPAWISYSIYRTDRAIPTTVRKYLLEVQNDHAIWQKMPRRMLRHRVMQQCSRIAFGIRISESTPKTVQAIEQKSVQVQHLQAKPDLNGTEASRATILKAFLSKQEDVSCPQGGSNRKSIMN
jgi:hypothetical protein